MPNAVAFFLCLVIGFVGSRRLRRPDRAAQAASVARSVGGSMGTRRGLDAPELQRACFSEMVRHVRVTRVGQTHAPAHYVLQLNPEDLAAVDEARRWFTDGLADALRQAATEHGWALDGTIQIDYRADPSRRRGVPGALAVAPGRPPDSAPTAAPPEAAARSGGSRSGAVSGLVLVRSDTGERIPLGLTPTTIGRSKDRTITVDDNRVSRSHARIERRSGGWWIVDEGSANGTRIAGTAIGEGQAHPLRPGDRIGVGPVEIRVSAGLAPSGQAGTRALDDSDRTRISAEILGVLRPGPPKR
ncbi:MAG: FhaA domain-containing protein [Aquihabitans sp.]